jgi:hypothetical protein
VTTIRPVERSELAAFLQALYVSLPSSTMVYPEKVRSQFLSLRHCHPLSRVQLQPNSSKPRQNWYFAGSAPYQRCADFRDWGVEKPIFSKASYYDDLVRFRETAISGVCTIGPQNGSNPFRAGNCNKAPTGIGLSNLPCDVSAPPKFKPLACSRTIPGCLL